MSGRRDVRDLPTLWPRYEQGVNLIDKARKDDIPDALTFQFLHRGTRVIKYEGLKKSISELRTCIYNF